MMNIKYLLPTFALVMGNAFAQQDDVLSSGLDKANMDLTAKPGTDFYQYATGVGKRRIRSRLNILAMHNLMP